MAKRYFPLFSIGAALIGLTSPLYGQTSTASPGTAPRTAVPSTTPQTATPSTAPTRLPKPLAYPITPQAGEWLICAKSYIGENARTLAEELAHEIRTQYNLPAYVFNRGAEERDREEKRLAEMRKRQEEFLRQLGAVPADQRWRYRTLRIEEQFAVLVGGYPSIEVARKELDKIRKLKPPAEKFMDRAVLVKANENNGNGSTIESAWVNPFQTAFIVHNPTIPMEKEDPNKPDPFLKDLNEGESLSVLKCRKDWTLVVKVYHGQTIVQPKNASSTFLSRLTMGGNKTDLLSAAAMQARSLAEYLRSMKEMPVEAYVMHTRHSSIVCVGQFDSPEDPKLQQMQKLLANMKITNKEKTIVLDQLSPQPLPMKIPRF